MRAAALLLLCAVVASAQPTDAPATSTVSGRVVNAETDEPVARAALRLMRFESGQYDFVRTNYGAVSDSAGNFEFPSVEPGRYRLIAARNGFVELEYGSADEDRTRPGGILGLKSAQELGGIDLRLVPHGVVTGRALGGGGEPISGGMVFLLRTRYVNGKKALTLARFNGRTDDRGEFRIFGLTPGLYYAYAQPGANGWSLNSSATEDFVPVYYPGAIEANGATPVEVTPGSETRLDFVLPLEKAVRVSGRVAVGVFDPDNPPVVRFSRVPFHQSPLVRVQENSSRATVKPDGSFEIRDLTPGSYIAVAAVRNASGFDSGRIVVEVGRSDIEGVVIPLGALRSLSGEVVLEGESRDLERPTIRLTPRSPIFDRDVSGRLAQDQKFRISGLEATDYDLSLIRLPEGVYLKSILLSGADVTYDGVDLTNGAIDGMQIVVSPNAGRVSGAVSNADTGEAELGATVVLVPDNAVWTRVPWRFAQATTDQYGRFMMTGVAPGKYHAYAWDQVEDTAWMDPEFIRPLRPHGKSITVEEDSEVGVQLDVIARETP